MQEEFPYWEHLHGYWCTLLNYNPLTVTSEPDQDLEGGALELFEGGATVALLDLGFEGEPPTHPAFATVDSLTPEKQAEINVDPDADAEGEDKDMADADVCFSPQPQHHRSSCPSRLRKPQTSSPPDLPHAPSPTWCLHSVHRGLVMVLELPR